MTGGATAQFTFGCRYPGCGRGFLTASRREAHETTDHAVDRRDIPVPAPVTAEERDPIARIEQALGPDEPEEDRTMPEIACTLPACTRTFTTEHGRDVHVARSHKLREADRSEIGDPPEPARVREARKPSPNGTVQLDRQTFDRLREFVQGRDPLDVDDPGSLRREADRLELESLLLEVRT